MKPWVKELLEKKYESSDLNYLIHKRCPGLLPIWNDETFKNYCIDNINEFEIKKIDCAYCWALSLNQLQNTKLKLSTFLKKYNISIPDEERHKGIKHNRISCRYTQQQFAEKCGVCANTIHKYEFGYQTPTKSTKHLIAKVLGAKISQLFK